MTLSDPQWRVLTALPRPPAWINPSKLHRLDVLEPGDTDCIQSLIRLKLIEQNIDGWIRITPAGQVIATEGREQPDP